jgi:hypothetical protein
MYEAKMLTGQSKVSKERKSANNAFGKSEYTLQFFITIRQWD